MSISYTRINWQDTAGGETPLNAENLNHMEQGIVDCANAIPSLPLSQQDGGTGVNGMSVAANKVFASPVSSSGEVSFRELNQADIPELNASKITLGTLPIERGGTGAGTEQAARTALGVPSLGELQALGDVISSIGEIRSTVPETPTAIPSANTSTVVCQLELSGGVWIVMAGSAFSTNKNGTRYICLNTNGSSAPSGRYGVSALATSSGNTRLCYAVPYDVTDTKTVYLWASQDSGSSLDVSGYIYAVKIK